MYPHLTAPVQMDTQTSIYLSSCLTPSLFSKALTYRHKFMSLWLKGDISLSLTLFFLLNQGLRAILSRGVMLCVHGRRFSSAEGSPHHKFSQTPLASPGRSQSYL